MMQLPQIPTQTKAQIEASNNHKREREVRRDIGKVEAVIQNLDKAEMVALHRYLDAKYQECISGWGKGMYGFNDELGGFNYEMLDKDSLKDNLTLMIPKLDAFIHGWNAGTMFSKTAPISTPEVNVTVNNMVTVHITFEQVREKVEDMTSLTDEQTKEVLQKVDEIEALVNGDGSKKSKWEKIKPILVWLADKSFDVAMTIMPLLLKLQQ